MSSRFQVLRRVGGPPTSPPDAGFLAGELAVWLPPSNNPNDLRGIIWAHDGNKWEKIGGDSSGVAGVTVVDFNAEPAALNEGDIGNAFVVWRNGAGANVDMPRDELLLATWGDPAATYMLVDDDNITLPTAWQLMGGGLDFALPADVMAGTAYRKIVNPQSLAYTSISSIAANANHVPEANKFVRLNPMGFIDNSLLQLDVMTYIGNANASIAATGAAVTAGQGDFITLTGAVIPPGSPAGTLASGTVEASWPGIAGEIFRNGDMAIFDGTDWHILAAEMDLSAYLELGGGQMLDGAKVAFDNATGKALPAGTPAEITAKVAAMTILDGDGGYLDNVILDSGEY